MYGRFLEIHSNLRRKKLHRTNQGSNFLGGSFSNRDNVRAPIQFRRESQIRKIIVNDQEIADPNEILKNEIRIFYESLFKKGDSKPASQINDFVDKVQLPKLNITESNECDNELSEKELYISLMSMQKNKSPGNDGLTKEFFVAFWEDIKDVFFLIHVVQQNLKRN